MPLLDLLGLFDVLDEWDDAGLEAAFVAWWDLVGGCDPRDCCEHCFVAELLKFLWHDFVHEWCGDCLYPC